MFDKRIVCIHSVDENTFSPEKLIRYIKRMVALGYRFVSVDDILNIKKGKMIALTVDDAYYCCIDNLLPVLDKYKIPALLFVPTLLLGLPENDPKILKNDGYKNQGIMSREDINLWLSKGNQIGFHTGNHIDLYNTTESDIEIDFRAGMQVITENGWKVKYFAYPKGYLPKNRDTFINLLKEFGFQNAFTVNWGCADRRQGFYVNRIILGNHENEIWTIIKSLGLADFMYNYKRRTKECIV